MSKKNKYAKKQQNYFAKKGMLETLKKEQYNLLKQKTEDQVVIDDIWKTQIVSDKYILLNPAFPIETAYALLNVHNKVKAGMLIKGKPEDFEDNPNEVYRVVKERKILDINKKDVNKAIENGVDFK